MTYDKNIKYIDANLVDNLAIRILDNVFIIGFWVLSLYFISDKLAVFEPIPWVLCIWTSAILGSRMGKIFLIK